MGTCLTIFLPLSFSQLVSCLMTAIELKENTTELTENHSSLFIKVVLIWDLFCNVSELNLLVVGCDVRTSGFKSF